MKALAGSIKYAVNTACLTPQTLDPMDKPLNHTTIAEDSTHSHRPHEKEGVKEGSLTSMAQARQTKGSGTAQPQDKII